MLAVENGEAWLEEGLCDIGIDDGNEKVENGVGGGVVSGFGKGGGS